MKKITLLALVPVLALTSCSKEMSQAEADKRIRKIEAAWANKEITEFDLSFDYHSVTGKGKDKMVVDATYRYKVDYDTNSTYYYQKGAISQKENTNDYIELVSVPDEEYEQIAYLRYDIEGEKGEASYTKKGCGDDFYPSPTFAQIMMYVGILTVTSVWSELTSPSNYSYQNESKYYSFGLTDLKIVNSNKYPKEDTDSETILKSKQVVEYYDYSPRNYSYSNTSSYGNKSHMEMECKYSGISVKLPSDWKKYLVQ